MQGNNSSAPQNDVNNTDPEAAQVGPVSIEQDAANRPDSQPAAAQDQQSQPSQGESNVGDSSGRIFSMYSKAAEDEDNKMAERWQKDAEGILIFTGLFSAAVAALLAVTVQNLIPSSQDTSAFYLGNIYQVLANTTHTPILFPVATSPTSSPPNYTIWVNSLWFLSLVISLTCALLATSSHQWARRYIRVTQPARCSPEKRARMRAFFANGVEKMQIARVVEGLPTLLHLSVFLFFAGLAILLFNINLAVFYSVAWLIVLFSIVYGLVTLMPLVWHDSPYYSPLSPPAWFLYASISYLSLKVLFAIKSDKIVVYKNWQYWRDLRNRYRGWIFGGVEKAAEETVSERLSDIDADILRWTIDDLGDDDEMENFFDAIPGFFKSKLVKDLRSKLSYRHRLLEKFWKASNGFFERTLSSNSVKEDVKSRRLVIGMDAMSTITIPNVSSIPEDILIKPWDQEPQNIEMGHTVAHWRSSENRDIAQYAQCIATRILATVRERNDRWIALATGVLGLSVDNLRAYIAHGNDSLSLAILMSVARQHIHSDFYDWGLLSTLYRLDIRNTLPELQHAFCNLWNECLEEATRRPPDTFPLGILRLTRSLYIRLHRGTHAAPMYFSDSTPDFHHILYRPQLYPWCNIPGHHPGSTIFDSLAVPLSPQPSDSPNASLHQPTYNSSDAQRLAEELYVITGTPLHDVITREMRRSSQALASPAISPASPVHTNPYSLDSNKRQNVAAPRAVPDIGQTSSTSPTSSPAPASTAPILDQPLGSYDAGPASISALPLPASSATPTSPSYTRRLPNPELLALLSGTPLSGPPDNATLSRLGARGLIDQGNMYSTNAVLQLLVYCPPFWNLFSDLGRLTGQTGQRGQGVGQQTSGGTKLLVDATVRLLDEFAYKREDDDTKPFTPTYVYDAMKEKRQFKSLLGGQPRDAAEYLGVYLDALDEELLALLTSISTHKPPAFTAPRIEESNEGSQSDEGQPGVGKRDYISPISRIFDGRFRKAVRMTDQDDTVKVESWRTLQLDIQPDSVHTVQDALALISQPQSVQIEPSDPSNASQQVTVLIKALPPVLIVHLKQDAVAGGAVKNHKPVQFSPELEIPPDIMVPTAGGPAVPARYTLYGVLYHHDTSASGGHYTVDMLHPKAHEGSGEAWLRIDDDVVSTVRYEEVFWRHNNERTDDRRCAYLLFYRRTASTQT